MISGQTENTDYFSIMEQLKECLWETCENNIEVNKALSYAKTPCSISVFLQQLIETTENIQNINKHGHRFSETGKLFGLYIYIIGGRLLYETLYSNLKKSLPSISTLLRSIDENSHIEEGVILFSNLKDYLIRKKYPLQIFVSEDQTAITTRIDYYSKTNWMIGFVSKLSDNGISVKNDLVFDPVNDCYSTFLNNSVITLTCLWLSLYATMHHLFVL